MSAKTTYLDFLDAVKKYYGSDSDEWVEISKYGLKADNAIEILRQVPNVDILQNSDGSIRSIAYKNFSTKGNRATFLAESIDSNAYNGTSNVKNSFNLSVPSNTTTSSTGTLTMGSEIGKKVSTGEKVIGMLGNIGQAVFAVATGVTLGKIIDSTLYSLNPDFWNAHDMETLDPSTWGTITNSGSLGDNLFNILMGVDPVTDETTAYVDQNALAYMAWYLQNKGIFDSRQESIVDPDVVKSEFPDLYNNLIGSPRASIVSESYCGVNRPSAPTIGGSVGIIHGGGIKKACMFHIKRSDNYSHLIFKDATDINNSRYYISTQKKDVFPNFDVDVYQQFESYNSLTHKGKKVYWSDTTIFQNDPNSTLVGSNMPIPNELNDYTGSKLLGQLSWVLMYGSRDIDLGITGVGTQPDATIPDLSNVKSVDDALNALKTQYPDLFENAITNSVPQEDGSIKNYTYVPITLPNTNNANDAQPTTGEQTQSKPKVDPNTSPDTLFDLISGLINNKLDTPNTPNTGSGSTPSIIPPVGSASALYKIYNPSQSQLDSFGQWLWSSSFVDQLLKVFNNPMESIIGLHKVYASPVIGGQSNIKVGYLDSGVPSNFVSNQYSKIDCGTVNLLEYFGNVFDYSPYTNIQLYLPCIGFVNLNVGEVMRSKLNIIYTVDVLTGACLAEVNVLRDGGGGVLYSYSGNCASQYPLSSGSYMGIVSSAIGIAGSVIGTVASGGSLAPLALGSMGAVMNAHTNVQHSGSLSGNSGVMGGKIPYLIITRPQTNMPNNYEHYQGIPSNFYTSLSSCNGFTKVKNVDVRNINAESNELDEIKSLLMDGVII